MKPTKPKSPGRGWRFMRSNEIPHSLDEKFVDGEWEKANNPQ